MELGLSLGDASKPFRFMDKNIQNKKNKISGINNGGFDFCMSLGLNSFEPGNDQQLTETVKARQENDDGGGGGGDEVSDDGDGSGGDAHLQLNLAPVAVLPRRWSSDNGTPSSENGASSAAWGKRDSDAAGNDPSGGSSRASDDDDNGVNGRKKLRLSKEQSAFLEESFKEHSTLNPKQKQALAKQLNLRPRQVEVWFQNRRARTKLKQTEVDCEYLKRCCETLTVENRRLHKELQELRALKTTSNPFYQQLPATTLTMCPSCERVATTTTAAAAAVSPPTAAANTVDSNSNAIPKAIAFPLMSRPRFYPFSQTPTHLNKPAAS